jgi:hypothetical protein
MAASTSRRTEGSAFWLSTTSRRRSAGSLVGSAVDAGQETGRSPRGRTDLSTVVLGASRHERPPRRDERYGHALARAGGDEAAVDLDGAIWREARSREAGHDGCYTRRMPLLFVFVDGVGAGSRDERVNPLARREFLLSRFADGSGAPGRRGGRPRSRRPSACRAARSRRRPGDAAHGENALRAIGAPRWRPDAARAHLEAIAWGARGAGRAATSPTPIPRFGALGSPATAIRSRRSLRCGGGRGGPRPRSRSAPAREVSHGADAGEPGPHPDITGVRSAVSDILQRTPAPAAEILRVAEGHDLTLFEFFETDEAGHARSMERALDALGRVDAFLRAILDGLPEGWSLVVASDHGNVEDLSLRNHTLAPVPVLAFGPAAAELDEVRDLTHVAALLRRFARLVRVRSDRNACAGSRLPSSVARPALTRRLRARPQDGPSATDRPPGSAG